MNLAVDKIVEVCKGVLIQGRGYVSGVAIDSRQVRTGDLFVPLKGEKVDGHDFAAMAVANGASALLWARPELPQITEAAVIQVASAKRALQDLAAWYLRQTRAKVVAVTGSVGKTSTKDLIAAVLRSKYSVVATRGNYNTEIGLPLMLFELTPETDYAVLEMGMRGPGQIARLAQIAPPYIGVLTNVGESHIELLGSREAIAQAKGELLEAIDPHGSGVVNGDDSLAVAQAARCPGRVVFYGLNDADSDRYLVTATDLTQQADGRVSFVLRVGEEEAPINLGVPGRHNVYNSLAAAAVGHLLGLTLPEIATGLRQAELTGMRCEILSVPEGYQVINDAYNACFDSMRAGLELLASLRKEGGRTIAILGDMFELGASSKATHERVGMVVAELGIDLLLAVGARSEDLAAGALAGGMTAEQIVKLPSTEDAVAVVRSIPRPNDVILVKGSRGMKMEQVVQVLTGEKKQ